MNAAAMKYLTVLLGLYSFTTFSQSNTPCTSGSVSAPALTVNASCSYTSGTTAGATQQTNANNGGTPSCGSMGEDVWYSFTAPASGSVTITTLEGSITDGVMAVYSGTCGSWTEIGCSDDDNGLMPEISLSGLTPGNTYLVRFWQYGGGTGTFDICIVGVAASGTNTTCSVPSPICSGSPISFVANAGGSEAATINPGNDYDCLFTSPNPSWYYLEIDQSGNLVIDITAGSDVDYEIWGPFPTLANAVSNCGTYAVPEDCSYSSSNIEQAVVNGVITGEVYVLLVTNYADVVQTININEAVANTASTNCAIVPLPVGYTQWDAQFTGSDVRLYWSTATEQNNHYFAVQRSQNGMVWETIGLVQGNGTSEEEHFYSYTDKTPLNGINYYRLMQVDTDGTPDYTDIRSVNTEKAERLAIYPNPASNNFTVRVNKNEVESVSLTDCVGHNYDLDYTSTGDELKLDCSEFASGIYTLTIISRGIVQSERLVIKK